MKKIIYIMSTLQKRGPVNVLFNLISNVDRTKYIPYIITLSKEPQNSLIQDFKKLNIEIVSLKLNRIFSFFYGPIKLKKIVNEIKPDVIHAHCFRSILFSALALNKYKKISTIHCDYKIYFQMFYGKLLGYIMHLLMSYSLSKMNKNICCSKELKNILNIKNKKIIFDYVDNGIDTDFFKPTRNKIKLRKKLNLPTEKKIFIWCGNMTEVKFPMILAKAIKELKNPNLYYIFCGSRGPLLEICKKELENNKNVLFTGYVNNIKDYLQASDFFISTSLSEGLPNGVLEALACGLPCILSDIPQHKYILENTENVGLFFETKNMEYLKEKINEILKIDYGLYSQNAISLIQNKFSSKLMSNRYQKYYE